jgi:ketosteroid isomerase-like protein
MKFRSLIFTLVFILGSTAAFAQTKDETAVIGLVKQMTGAQIKYDAAALDKIFTPDYIEISPKGEFDPREKVLGFYKPENDPGDKFKAAVDATASSFRQYGKIAVLIVQLNYIMTADGKSLPPRSMRATFVCLKDKGQWKIASAQYTGIPPKKV